MCTVVLSVVSFVTRLLRKELIGAYSYNIFGEVLTSPLLLVRGERGYSYYTFAVAPLEFENLKT